MNIFLRLVLSSTLLTTASFAASEPVRKLTPNDELILAVKGTARSVAWLAAVMVPIPGIFFAMGTDPAEGDSDLQEISTVLAKGANINYQDPWGYTALQYAAYYGYPKIAQYLLYRGADRNIVDEDGYNALGLAEFYVNKYQRMFTTNKDASMVKHYEEKILRYQQVVRVLQ